MIQVNPQIILLLLQSSSLFNNSIDRKKNKKKQYSTARNIGIPEIHAIFIGSSLPSKERHGTVHRNLGSLIAYKIIIIIIVSTGTL